jgi:hypothetical protein
VAAILDDPAYEAGDVVNRLRLADDVRLLAATQGQTVSIGDRDGENAIDVASDQRFIRSLNRLGVVSLAPGSVAEGNG